MGIQRIDFERTYSHVQCYFTKNGKLASKYIARMSPSMVQFHVCTEEEIRPSDIVSFVAWDDDENVVYR
jgi:hypothetical protein